MVSTTFYNQSSDEQMPQSESNPSESEPPELVSASESDDESEYHNVNHDVGPNGTTTTATHHIHLKSNKDSQANNVQQI